LDIVFAGTPTFAVPALVALDKAGHRIRAVYTQPDRPAGRGRLVTASPVKERALELGLTVEQPATLRSQDAIEKLRSHAPELMVVVAYGLILPQAVLDVPSLGCLNIHASLLPRWRGAAPIERAIETGDTETGVTIMKMDAGLDTGPMLLSRRTLIGPHETAGSLHDRLAQIGAEALLEAIATWQNGHISPRAQATSGATYARKIERGEAAIDWTRDAVELDRQSPAGGGDDLGGSAAAHLGGHRRASIGRCAAGIGDRDRCAAHDRRREGRAPNRPAAARRSSRAERR
jgi:methionyl-tRNA formyltransferase